MAKKRLEIILKNDQETINTECVGIVTDNKLKYNDNGILVILTIEKNKVHMVRENDEYQLNLEFSKESKNTLGSYLLKENNIILDLDIITNNLKITSNCINITYTLNDNTIMYTVYIKE